VPGFAGETVSGLIFSARKALEKKIIDTTGLTFEEYCVQIGFDDELSHRMSVSSVESSRSKRESELQTKSDIVERD
jgi:hypothetical protein